jgi:mono/diheme cytochrome c family protein
MRILTATAAFLTLSAACFGQSQDPAKKINKVPVEYTNPASGAEMFKSYCAACHGPDGKGGGPAATALTKAPADLTLLTKKNRGKFPALEVQNTIKGDPSTAAHGSRDMPMWGGVFQSVSAGTGVVDIRIRNLRDYIESLQQK